ncbi:MAG: RipA family octameric membrane protein [Planctomycetota bacterium]|jgi:hypothetical protein
MAEFDKFEEYKLFVDDTARFTERRQTVANIYVPVNTLLLAAIGLLIKEGSPWTLLLLLPLITAGIFVCLWWRQHTRKYKMLVGMRIRTLREMEDEMPESVKMYHVEDELYPRDKEGKMIRGEGLNFSDIESRLPMLFVVLYCLFGVVSLTAAVVRMCQVFLHWCQ